MPARRVLRQFSMSALKISSSRDRCDQVAHAKLRRWRPMKGAAGAEITGIRPADFPLPATAMAGEIRREERGKSQAHDRRTHGVLIVTPEYNSSVLALVKIPRLGAGCRIATRPRAGFPRTVLRSRQPRAAGPAAAALAALRAHLSGPAMRRLRTSSRCHLRNTLMTIWIT